MSRIKTGKKNCSRSQTDQAPPTSTPPQPRFVGVDLHKQIATFHTMAEDGKTLEQGRFDVNPEAILKFANEKLQAADSVAVEVTSNTWAFVRLIRSHVDKVVVSNPMKTKAIAEASVKTDKVDAKVLAHLLRCNYLPSVWTPTETIENSRALAARRTALVGQRTALRNRIHSVLARRLVVVPAGGPFTQAGLTWLQELSLDPVDRTLIDTDLRLLEGIAQEMQEIEHLIVKESYDDPDIRLLMTLPGLDFTIAQALKACLADISRFPNPDKAASYLGLTPRIKQSAGKCYHGSITKAGSSQTRWLLIQAAQSVGRTPGPLGAFFRKLEKKKNRNIAVVATARKLVTIAWHMLKNKEPYRYAVPRTTENKLGTLRVRATGEKRKGGSPKGPKPEPRFENSDSRRIPSLDEIYTREDVPGRRPLSEGEKRMIREAGVENFVAELGQTRIVPRKKRVPASTAQ